MGYLVLWLLLGTTGLAVWGLSLLLLSRTKAWLRVTISSLSSGVIWSGLFMWEDAADGFCCREYHASVWTELYMYVPLAIVFAGASALVVAMADFFRRRVRA
jgi:hypothetical protein